MRNIYSDDVLDVCSYEKYVFSLINLYVGIRDIFVSENLPVCNIRQQSCRPVQETGLCGETKIVVLGMFLVCFW